MIAGWVISRVADLRSKLHFALGLAYTSWYDRKARARRAKLTLQCLALSSPVPPLPLPILYEKRIKSKPFWL